MRTQSKLAVLTLVAAAGCSHSTASSVLPNAQVSMPTVHAPMMFKTIYSFNDSPDGSNPRAGVTVSPLDSNYLFGTTVEGGKGPGTLWSVNLSDDTETVVYKFPGKPDGSRPFAPLAVLDHFFYGTTAAGGTYGNGTVYKIPDSGSGTPTVIHSFNRIRRDGASPGAAVTVVGHELYGTTTVGGEFDKGTVFKVDAAGTGPGSERRLHSFTGNPDGAAPNAELTLWDGKLYGTTEKGGANDHGCVFEIPLDGVERVLYSFKGKPDGGDPRAGVTALKGALYGVTTEGGPDNNGTVYEIDKDGTERVIHSFVQKTEGAFPEGSLTVFDGALYGTARVFGASDFGTVFEVHPDGRLRVLHSFGGADGAFPWASLTAHNGRLYGTTSKGGANQLGTVFEITP
jgi:uncharacterized repeat protein (TIGR03803 family)